ncbi:benzoate 4-monooxygenase cytochrome P450 [Didymella exigua CBS 183.55]|uniref:Benzoate 4-monooxygenase cytochrome P450 n=1 Tax=Didymella exigua CBS 183.55 TaxID=1150837 RepID=A0A6A5RRX9_9PLEO|nr:benzoate 4-monooxygenase cytochrome P450 [Didymella exigua CBS 183.55]KAF1931191.1 benzoate 4-monooxygenase cytochrome P450 [Didymella exigua CBS 183.55]
MTDSLSSSESALGLLIHALLPLLTVFLFGGFNVWIHPLRHYPGPILWRAFRLPYVVAMHKGQLHKRLKEFHTMYGSIVRIAPNELSYADSWPFHRNRTWFKKHTPDGLHSIMGFDEASHARYKRAFVNAFSDKSLRDQAPIVEGYVDLLVSKLRQSTSKIAELEDVFQSLAFDIGSELSFGESFDSTKSGKTHPWVEVAKDFGKGLALIASINQYPPVDQLLRFVIPKKVLAKMKDHAIMSNAMSQKRLAMDTDRPDFVTPTKKHVEAKGGIGPEEWGINLMILVFASSETIATALVGIFRHLVQHSGVLQHLTTELRTTFSSEDEIRIDPTMYLPYLDAVINEGLRLNPPVAIGAPPKVVPKGGDTTYVSYNQFAANRQAYNFHLPNTFLPERFLASHNHPKDDMTSFNPFSVGRHQFIGLKLAYAEMRIIVARMIFAFDLKLADEKDRFDWGEQETYIFWKKRPLNVVLFPTKELS